MLSSARSACTPKRVHRALLVVWLLLIWPSVALWRDSVPWLVFMSHYACIVGHWGGDEAAKATEAATAS